MKNEFIMALEDCPIIAAVKDREGLAGCLASDSKIIFILFGDILDIGEIVEEIKQGGRIAMVHLDLVAGLNGREIGVDYIKYHTRADGIITTKPALIKRAKELGLYTVLRFFAIDSRAYDNIAGQSGNARPDCIEILPGVMPKVIKRICGAVRTPVIAGGLIADREDILAALQAGAVSISTTNREVWFL